jgi:hypothetical protein
VACAVAARRKLHCSASNACSAVNPRSSTPSTSSAATSGRAAIDALPTLSCSGTTSGHRCRASCAEKNTRLARGERVPQRKALVHDLQPELGQHVVRVAPGRHEPDAAAVRGPEHETGAGGPDGLPEGPAQELRDVVEGERAGQPGGEVLQPLHAVGGTARVLGQLRLGGEGPRELLVALDAGG